MQFSQWGEALRQFEQIETRLDDIPSEAVRWVNHAIALKRLGRDDEAAEVIRREMLPQWPVSELRKARQLLEAANLSE
jgi:hypothetical protein